jgi:iron complex outermembrane receptor protein
MLGMAPSMLAAQSLDYHNFEGMFDEPVTSSATGKPERLSDVPVVMHIITADDISRSGARDLASLLRSLPGVSNYRGFNGSEPFTMGALLLNGREIYTSTFDQLLLVSLPVELDEIRQIEVVSGPQSALYGFNGSQGVINIITFDPAQTAIGRVAASVGNHARRDGSAIVTLPLADGAGLRLSAAGDHVHESGDVPLSGKPLPPINPDRQSLAANFSAYLGNGGHLTAEASHSDVSLRAMVPEVTTLLDMRVQTDAVKADYSADTAIGLTSLLVSFDSLSLPQGATVTASWFSQHDHVVDSKISDLVKLGNRDTLRFEVENRHESVHASMSAAGVATSLYAGSTMWEHGFAPGLTMVNVARYVSSESQQGDSSEPASYALLYNHGLANNSALLYKPDAEDEVRAIFARGITLPSQLAVAVLGITQFANKKTSIADDSDLKQGRNSEYRLSWDHHFSDLGFSSRLDLFHRISQDVLGLFPLQLATSLSPSCLKPTPRSAALCAIAAREGQLSGVVDGGAFEIGNGAQSGLVWNASYSLERSHPHLTALTASEMPALGNGQIVQRVTGELGYVWPQWTADLRLSYAAARQDLTLSLAPVPSVGLLDNKEQMTVSPHLAWTPRDDLSLDLTAENLGSSKIDLLQRSPTSYFATVKWRY